MKSVFRRLGISGVMVLTALTGMSTVCVSNELSDRPLLFELLSTKEALAQSSSEQVAKQVYRVALQPVTTSSGTNTHSLQASMKVQTTRSTQFYCGKTNDPRIQQVVPTTLATVPGRKGTVAVIRWRSEFFEQFGMSPIQRCERASAEFQKALKEDRTWLVSSDKDEQSVICLVKSEDDRCGSDYLFALKPEANVQVVIKQLVNLLEGQVIEPISQHGRDDISIDLLEILQKQKPERSF